MAQAMDGLVEREMFIAAAPETVFAFFTEAQKMKRWLAIEATLEAQPGGTLHVNVTGEHVGIGEYVEVTPHERVVFTWGWEGGETLPPGRSLVEVTLEPKDSGTLLRLVHSGLPMDVAARHGEGWDHHLERLAIAARGDDPGPDAWVETEACSTAPAS